MRFDMTDQLKFAALSGDFNPLHVDTQVARRTLFGRPVVHGVHLVLWALDVHLERPVGLRHVDVTFLKSVGVGEIVSSRLVRSDSARLEIEIDREGSCVGIIRAEIDGVAPRCLDVPDMALPHGPCRDWSGETVDGAFDLSIDRDAWEKCFPRLSRRLPVSQAAVLLAATRLVGMECPGLHSIFSRFDIGFRTGQRLNWKLAEYDDRVGLVVLALEGAAIGTITALLRPKPQQQPHISEITPLIPKGAFAGMRPLVIGGARGLGEVSAKILAAGGADVRLTYRSGGVDADAVVEDIRSAGLSAAALEFDVMAPPTDLADRAGAGWEPTQICYFATPPIFVATRSKFSSVLFSEFCDIYVTGVSRTYEAVRKITVGNLTLLYPSSVAVDQIPADMGEYAAAKMAGETVCRYLSGIDPKLTIRIDRLPRLPTDQTATMRKVKAGNAVESMARILLASV